VYLQTTEARCDKNKDLHLNDEEMRRVLIKAAAPDKAGDVQQV
jgi:hypothetical protein